MCVHCTVHKYCTQYCTVHRTDLIIFPLTLQTIIIAPMMSKWGKVEPWNTSLLKGWQNMSTGLKFRMWKKSHMTWLASTDSHFTAEKDWLASLHDRMQWMMKPWSTYCQLSSMYVMSHLSTGFALSYLQKIPGLFQNFPGHPQHFSRTLL